MPYSEDVDKKINSFYAIEDIISAMKAYAGVTIRQTEEIVPNVRQYEDNVLSVMAALIVNHPELTLMKSMEAPNRCCLRLFSGIMRSIQ